MNIYQSKFLEINYFADNQLIEATWLPETTNMNVEEYKIEFLNLLSLFATRNINKLIADQKKLFFMVVPEVQEWVNKNIFVKMPPINLAVVLPEDIIAQLAVEQLLDEQESKIVFKTKFFDDKEKAKAWILGS